MKLFSDRGRGSLVRGDRSVIARSTNKQTHLTRPGPTTAFRPCSESAIQITGKNRDIAAGQECSDATFEFLQGSVRRAGALRENDQDIASLSEKFTANR